MALPNISFSLYNQNQKILFEDISAITDVHLQQQLHVKIASWLSSIHELALRDAIRQQYGLDIAENSTIMFKKHDVL